MPASPRLPFAQCVFARRHVVRVQSEYLSFEWEGEGGKGRGRGRGKGRAGGGQEGKGEGGSRLQKGNNETSLRINNHIKPPIAIDNARADRTYLGFDRSRARASGLGTGTRRRVAKKGRLVVTSHPPSGLGARDTSGTAVDRLRAVFDSGRRLGEVRAEKA